MTDPCAEFPDAPAPEPYRPPPGTYARVGTKKPRNLYLVTPDQPDGLDIGRCDLPEYAGLVVAALNAYLGGAAHEGEGSDDGRPDNPAA